MNYNVLRYRMARNALADSHTKVARLSDRPVCSLSSGELSVLAAAEERTVVIPQMIDRLRFLAKHDRSKYMPHVGAHQRSKNDSRSVCCLPAVIHA